MWGVTSSESLWAWVCGRARAVGRSVGRSVQMGRARSVGVQGRTISMIGAGACVCVDVCDACLFNIAEEFYGGAQGVDEDVDFVGGVVKVEGRAGAAGGVQISVKGLRAVMTASASDTGLV